MISLGNLYSYLDEQAELERKAWKQSMRYKIKLLGRKRKSASKKDGWLRQYHHPAREPFRQFAPQTKLECCSRGIA